MTEGRPGRGCVGKESRGTRAQPPTGHCPRQTGASCAEGRSRWGLLVPGPSATPSSPGSGSCARTGGHGSAPGQLSPQDSHRGTHTPLTTAMPRGHVCRAENTFLPTKLNQKWQDASLALRIITPSPRTCSFPGEQGRCREGARPGTRGAAAPRPPCNGGCSAPMP